MILKTTPGIRLAYIIAFMMSSGNVLAENWVDRTEINGFMSTRYSLTDEAQYFQGTAATEGINEDGSFKGTKFGININSKVSDRLTVASQFRAGIGDNNYDTTLDWAFASLKLSDEIDLRLGKIKFPVGIVNEYIDVGVAYPWIEAPMVIYSESSSGPQATREAFTGAGLQWERELDAWTLGADAFFGQVNLDGMRVKKLLGLTARAGWDDVVQIQASTYQGDMKPDDTTTMMGGMMSNKQHSATLVGINADWNNIVFFGEWADVEMDVSNMMGVKILDSSAWYTTLGYRLSDQLMPYATHQQWEQGDGDGHKIATAGLRYGLSPSIALKLEQSNIKTTNTGLFAAAPTGDTAMTSIAIDVIF